MSTVAAILLIVPSVLYLCGSILQTYVALKRLKEEKKDEIWETTTRLLAGKDGISYPEEFAEVYSGLKFIKEHPEYNGRETIETFLHSKHLNG